MISKKLNILLAATKVFAEDAAKCDTVIGFLNERPNTWCQSECRKYLESHTGSTFENFLGEYKEQCHYQIFRVDDGNGRILRDECFSNWTMFEAVNRPNIYKTVGDVHHPVTCQTLCQQAQSGCERWEWEWKTGNCYQYSRAQARYYTASKTETTNNPALSDSLCTNTADCLYCGGAITSAVVSSDSLSGWKWCKNYRDDCRLPSAPTKNYYLGVLRGPRGGPRYSVDQRGQYYSYYDQVTGQIPEALPESKGRRLEEEAKEKEPRKVAESGCGD